jgi:hypothetical protein
MYKLKPVTPEEAKKVWNSLRRPSARRVAQALTQAGMVVHFARSPAGRLRIGATCLRGFIRYKRRRTSLTCPFQCSPATRRRTQRPWSRAAKPP